MVRTHAESPVQSIRFGRFLSTIVLLAVIVGAAIAFSLSGAGEAPSTPSLDRLRELASIYDGEQFGYVPAREASTPSLDRLRELASIYDGEQFGYVPLDE